MSPLVLPEDMIVITGFAKPAKQREFLTSRGINYLERGDGRPIITWEYLNNYLLLPLHQHSQTDHDHRNSDSDEPDYTAVKT